MCGEKTISSHWIELENSLFYRSNEFDKNNYCLYFNVDCYSYLSVIIIEDR